MSRWLAGVRILDLSQYIPGPLASLLLADMGAEVLKIEPPSGDPMQTLGPRNREGEGLFIRRSTLASEFSGSISRATRVAKRCWSLRARPMC